MTSSENSRLSNFISATLRTFFCTIVWHPQQQHTYRPILAEIRIRSVVPRRKTIRCCCCCCSRRRDLHTVLVLLLASIIAHGLPHILVMLPQAEDSNNSLPCSPTQLPKPWSRCRKLTRRCYWRRRRRRRFINNTAKGNNTRFYY